MPAPRPIPIDTARAILRILAEEGLHPSQVTSIIHKLRTRTVACRSYEDSLRVLEREHMGAVKASELVGRKVTLG